MSDGGWIKLYRKLQEKAFYRKDSEAVHLWIHILISANHAEREETLGGKTIVCKPGQFTTGRKQLAESTGINESKIERLLKKFEEIEQQIEQQKTSTNRLITVRSWSEYQGAEQESEQQPNNDRTTTEQRPNTLEEYKEVKNVKKNNPPNPQGNEQAPEDKDLKILKGLEIGPDYFEAFHQWLKYKRKKGQSYKSPESVALAYREMVKLAGNNPIVAQAIVEQSMANNWAGLFELKQQRSNGTRSGLLAGQVIKNMTPDEVDAAIAKFENQQ